MTVKWAMNRCVGHNDFGCPHNNDCLWHSQWPPHPYKVSAPPHLICVLLQWLFELNLDFEFSHKDSIPSQWLSYLHNDSVWPSQLCMSHNGIVCSLRTLCIPPAPSGFVYIQSNLCAPLMNLCALYSYCACPHSDYVRHYNNSVWHWKTFCDLHND